MEQHKSIKNLKIGFSRASESARAPVGVGRGAVIFSFEGKSIRSEDCTTIDTGIKPILRPEIFLRIVGTTHKLIIRGGFIDEISNTINVYVYNNSGKICKLPKGSALAFIIPMLDIQMEMEENTNEDVSTFLEKMNNSNADIFNSIRRVFYTTPSFDKSLPCLVFNMKTEFEPPTQLGIVNSKNEIYREIENEMFSIDLSQSTNNNIPAEVDSSSDSYLNPSMKNTEEVIKPCCGETWASAPDSSCVFASSSIPTLLNDTDPSLTGMNSVGKHLSLLDHLDETDSVTSSKPTLKRCMDFVGPFPDETNSKSVNYDADVDEAGSDCGTSFERYNLSFKPKRGSINRFFIRIYNSIVEFQN